MRGEVMILSKLGWFDHLLGKTLKLEAGWSSAFHYVFKGASQCYLKL